MIVFIGISYSVALVVAVVGWNRWRELCTSVITSNRVKLFLNTLYILLAFSLIGCGLYSVAFRDYDLTEGVEAWFVLIASSVLMVQTAIFAVVIAPVAQKRWGHARGFWSTVVMAELCLLMPVVVVLAFNFWFFTRTGALINNTLGH
ncbi:MAG: hypothetical protein KIS67_21010 [Verrucomicrobiae bacterium]|nr:hypothetical protein [Verrucomicrobiae bacterium]